VTDVVTNEVREHVLTLKGEWGTCRCGWSTRYGTSDARHDRWRTHVEAAAAPRLFEEAT
jgi:hypothetical protein